MKFYLLYFKTSLLKNFKQFISMFLIIILIIILITVTVVMLDSRLSADIKETIDRGNDYHLSISTDDLSIIDKIQNNKWVNNVSLYSCSGFLFNNIMIFSDDTKYGQVLINDYLVEGKAPGENEIAININDKIFFGDDVQLNDEVTVNIDLFNGIFIEKTYKISGFFDTSNTTNYSLKYSLVLSSNEINKLYNENNLVRFYVIRIELKKPEYAERFINENTDNELHFEINESLYSVIEGTVFLLPYTIICIFILFAGCGLIIVTLNIMQKNQEKFFSILRSIGYSNKKIRNISIINILMITLLSIPIGIILGTLIVKFLVPNDDMLLIFTVNAFSILKILLTTMFVIMISIYIPFFIMKKKDVIEGLSKKYNKTNVSEKLSFSIWYSLKVFLTEKSKYVVIILCTALCFTSIGTMLYFHYKMEQDIPNIYNVDADFSLTKTRSETPWFSENLCQEIKKIDGIDNIYYFANTIIASSFNHYHNENEEHDHETISNKLIMIKNKNKRYTEDLRIDIFTEPELAYREKETFKYIYDYVIEGDADCVFNDNGKVIVFDNNWSVDDSYSWHVGDTIELQKQFSDNRIIKYTFEIGAVVKSEASKYFRFYTDFPILMSASDYRDATEQTEINEIWLDIDASKKDSIIQTLKKLTIDEEFYINNFMESDEYNDKFHAVFNYIIEILCYLIILAMIYLFYVFYKYLVNKRLNEISSIYKIGISKSNIIKIFINESLIISIISSIIIMIGTYAVSKSIFSFAARNNIADEWYLPPHVYMLPIIICILASVLSIIIAIFGLFKHLKNEVIDNA